MTTEMTKDNSNDWISNDNFSKVLTRLLALHGMDPKLIDGSMLALLAKRMLASEDQVGGPYSDKGVDKLELNSLIAQLFRSFGTPLINVETYLEKTATKKLDLTSIVISNTPNKQNDAPSIEIDKATKSVLKEIKKLGSISAITEKLWHAIVAFDHRHEISSLTQYFVDSLSNKPNVSDRTITLLGEANFFAWMSYYIYDDVIDGEDKTNLIPVANILQRIAIDKYQLTIDRIYINSYFDEVDRANFYELNNYRFKITSERIEINKIQDSNDNDFIASTAIGHILGPMIVLEKYSQVNDKQKDFVSKGFRHYLIARKLNDDAHDWIEDLKNGHASLVLCFLFQKISLKPGSYIIEDLTKTLKQYFWESGLQEITDLTITHVNKSREYFIKSELLLETNIFFREIIDPIEAAAKEGTMILKNQKDFLKTFTN